MYCFVQSFKEDQTTFQIIVIWTWTIISDWVRRALIQSLNREMETQSPVKPRRRGADSVKTKRRTYLSEKEVRTILHHHQLFIWTHWSMLTRFFLRILPIVDDFKVTQRINLHVCIRIFSYLFIERADVLWSSLPNRLFGVLVKGTHF